MVQQNGRILEKCPAAPGSGGNGEDVVDRSISTTTSSIMDTGNDGRTASRSSSQLPSTGLPLEAACLATPSKTGAVGSGAGLIGSCTPPSPSASAKCSSQPGSASSSSGGERNSHEQPVNKRQRIEHDRDEERTAAVRQALQGGSAGSSSSSSTSNAPATSRSNGMVPVAVATFTATPSSSSGNSSKASSSTSLSSSPSCSSTKLIPSSLEHSSDEEHQQQQQQQQQQGQKQHPMPPPHLLQGATGAQHETNLQHLHHHHHSQHHSHQHHLHVHQQQQQQQQQDTCHARFQEAIGRQCLCALDSDVLLACFKAYRTYEDATTDAPATVLPLARWPFEHLLRFLSNVQLLFDTYLKQNIKGNICAGVMELCNYLIRGDGQQQGHHNLLDLDHHHHHHQLDHEHLLLQHHHHQHHPHQHLHQQQQQQHQHLHLLPRPAQHGLATLDVDELIGLCSCSSKYLSYLAGRILSSFLIIVKDDPDDDRWLEKLVAALFDFGHLDLRAVRKISASLEVIKRIVEWKDETEHPLDEDPGGGGGGGGPGDPDAPGGSAPGGTSEWPTGPSGGSSTIGGGAYGVPPLAENYFSAHYQYGSGEQGGQTAAGGQATSSIFHPAGEPSSSTSAQPSTVASSSVSKAPGGAQASAAATASSQGTPLLHHHHHHHHLQHHHHHQLPASPPSPNAASPHPLPPPGGGTGGGGGGGGCRYVTLTDSESFDTTRIKCEAINILGGKWSALVKHISSLLRAQANSSQPAVVIATETCILTFLRLWESIISVKANLSVVETQPFHSQLDSFQLLLLVTKNAVIYRQMLTLFNEALCYGSTLALQDFIPEEVGSLAHNIVRSVKDYRILDKMPKSSYSNHLGFLGYQGQMVRYQDRRLQRVQEAPAPASSAPAPGPAPAETCYDRTLLQKMALLVLKAVAVIVKEIRCDSSDSSVDSSDFDMQEIQMIERSIRDVVKKLETFLKAQLEFHPESHLSKVLIHLFDDQDDYLVEAMVCTLDVTSGISFRNNAFPELIAMLNPVYTFIEFSNLGPNITHLFLDLLISPETCFLLFLLRFLKYIRQNWSMFTQSCYNYYRHNSYSNAATLLQNRLRAAAAATAGGAGAALVLPGAASGQPGDATGAASNANVILDSVMTVLISLRMQISRLVADTLFPYNITPILRLIENCESLYEGNELS